jgi:undecaprenyl-phosphate 4-deoxy-4-formamido-L-arabinose transferase
MLQCREHSTFIPILANSFAGSTAEIHVKHAPRDKGQSKYSFWKLISLQFDLLTSISTFPLRLLSFVGAVVAAGGIGFGVLLVVLRFAYGATWAAEGVFTLFAVLFIFIGAQFIGLGLLGEYIGRIYQDVRSRPRFFVEEIHGANRWSMEEKRTLPRQSTNDESDLVTATSGALYESRRTCLP